MRVKSTILGLLEGLETNSNARTEERGVGTECRIG